MDSRRIDSDSIVDMIFHLKWKSDAAIHTEGYQASRINIWRDYIPPFLLDAIKGFGQQGEKMTPSPHDVLFGIAQNNLLFFKYVCVEI